MPISTRTRIIHLLNKYGGTSAAQLSSELGLTKANIQYHLKNMLAENAIEAKINLNPSGEPGRPRRYFRITQTERPNNHVELLIALLDELSFPEKYISAEKLSKIAHTLIGQVPEGQIVARFNQSINWLNQCGYQAHWETHRNGALFLFRNCPYEAIWTKHPELCHLDQSILEQLTGCKFELKTKILPENKTVHYCAFRLLSQ